MSDVKRVWTAEEILGELPEACGDDPGHDAMLRELAAYLARCTRLMQALDKEVLQNDAIAEASTEWDAHAVSAAIGVERYVLLLRTAVDEEDDK